MPIYRVLTVTPTTLTGDILGDIDHHLYMTYAGSPVGNLSASLVGQLCYDSLNGEFYYCTVTDNTVGGTTWELLLNLALISATETTPGIVRLSDATDMTILSDASVPTVKDVDDYYLRKTDNLASVADISAARVSLGLNNAATKAVGTTVNTVAAGDHTHVVSILQDATAVGLSLLTSADVSAARTSLQLGDSAVKNVGVSTGTVSAGDHTHLLSSITDAGTAASLDVGTTTGTVSAGDHTHLLSSITDAGTAASLDVGTTTGTVSAGDHTHSSASISDATSAGVSLLTSANSSAQRTLLELGTASIKNVGTSGDTIPVCNTANIFSARQSAIGVNETYVALSALNIDLATGAYFSKTITANVILTISSIPTSGNVTSFYLELTNGGAYTVTYWTGIKWASGTIPSLTPAGVDLLFFITKDGGTTYVGSLVCKDFR